ncbi:vacuolar protein sorting-associated protein 9A-like isoform X2 [Vigna unguiculata]|uniref:vacuolar protein sorting-associated protein 9A-like isoform X2 n=1 Tax=Vigna unguiculata TaxID=3917 RepID=UPI001016A750|nr:vacuolar protein sorting-associated protein 9A-like isoform X2 [Vigna unguiculata]
MLFQSLMNWDYSININNMNTDTVAESRSTTPFTDCLNRMHHPASLDLVRSIKSFIVSFSFYQPKPENDGKRVQDFFLSMEAAMRDHPLWTTASEEDIDCALEGLEKYVMIKLFSRTFSATPEDAKIDNEISEKISLLQTFLKPEHLDIPPILQNEASLLLAEKELLKINAFKSPHEKLLSILNCCRVINNVLLNVAMSEHVPAGADDFLPVLIYVTIKANPSKLHSNLKFIKLFRRQEKLISEAEYYFTNLVSATSFIVDLNAKSLSMDENKFEESMQAAKLMNKVTNESSSTCQMSQQQNNECSFSEKMPHKPNATGVFEVLEHGSNYPYMEAESKGLTVGDVEMLLSDYKDLVNKYTILCKAISCLSTSEREPLLRQIEKQSAATLISHHPGTHQHN